MSEISAIGGPDRPKIVEFLILTENRDFEFPMKSQKFLPPSPHRTILGLRIQNYKNPEKFKMSISKNNSPQILAQKIVLRGTHLS